MGREVCLLLPLYPLLLCHRHRPPGRCLPGPHPQVTHPGGQAGHLSADEGCTQETAVGAEHLARYKLPKALVLVDEISRSPSGKPDYAWARDVAVAAEAS